MAYFSTFLLAMSVPFVIFYPHLILLALCFMAVAVTTLYTLTNVLEQGFNIFSPSVKQNPERITYTIDTPKTVEDPLDNMIEAGNNFTKTHPQIISKASMNLLIEAGNEKKMIESATNSNPELEAKSSKSADTVTEMKATNQTDDTSTSDKPAFFTLSEWKEKYQTLKQEWLSYELDIVKSLTYPALLDFNEPTTYDFHKAMRKVELLLNDDNTSRTDIVNAISDCEISFKRAESYAFKNKLKGYSDTERKRLTDALPIASLTQDVQASDSERESATKALLNKIDGLITLPEATQKLLQKNLITQG